MNATTFWTACRKLGMDGKTAEEILANGELEKLIVEIRLKDLNIKSESLEASNRVLASLRRRDTQTRKLRKGLNESAHH